MDEQTNNNEPELVIDDPFSTKVTTSTIFLLPPFQIPEEELKANSFWNAYIADADREHEHEGKNLLYCLFKPKSDFYFRRFLDTLEKSGIVLDDYDYEDGFVVVVLIFPEKFADDYKLITKGKYSKCSKAFKNLFPKERAIPEKNVIVLIPHITRRVFEKMEILKDAIQNLYGVNVEEMGPDFEYWKAFDKEQETLNITNIINKIKE